CPDATVRVLNWLTHDRRWTMSMRPHRRAVLLGVASLVLVAGSVLTVEAQKKGGILKVGNLGEPPALDAHWTTASITEMLTNHVYEGLYSLDNGNRPIPMLAESHTVSKDGLVYTFKLRQGVKFHNGKEMTSEDVVASLARWGKQSIYGKVRFDHYKSRNEKPNGYGGGKTAYLDEVRFQPVPEVATRVAQVETGELDFADDLNLDAYDRLKKNPNLRPIVTKPYYWLVAVLNKKEGLMTNQKLRQAWQAAIDIEPIMKNVAGG